jgi:hypothetical protein
MMTLFEVGSELSHRLQRIFLRDEHGKRAVFGGDEYFNNDPQWRDLVPFYEYFHGDNGAGIGASHQTGWTGIISRLIQASGCLTASSTLKSVHVSDIIATAINTPCT